MRTKTTATQRHAISTFYYIYEDISEEIWDFYRISLLRDVVGDYGVDFASGMRLRVKYVSWTDHRRSEIDTVFSGKMFVRLLETPVDFGGALFSMCSWNTCECGLRITGKLHIEVSLHSV